MVNRCTICPHGITHRFASVSDDTTVHIWEFNMI
jgi:hypothetical protein